jgi:multiple sugar transport system substrate-binding protein
LSQHYERASVVNLFKENHKDVDVVLNPFMSGDEDYYTKSALMLKSDQSLDVILADGFLVPSYVSAGYLRPIDLQSWPDWKQFPGAIKASVTIDGKVYAVPVSTDTQGLYYNAKAFAKAGIAVPWSPTNWNDLTSAALKLRDAKVPFPMWMYTSQAQGEASTMRTYMMLLSGTKDWVIENGKWVVKSQGMRDSLEFLAKLFVKERILGSDANLALMMDSHAFDTKTEKLPAGDIGFLWDGSWNGGDFVKSPPSTYKTDIRTAPVPRQFGGGYTTMSGGWTMAVSALTLHPDLADDFVKAAGSFRGELAWANFKGDMTPRSDVRENAAYKQADYYRYQMNKYVDFTRFRPGDELYPKVSLEIRAMLESVVSGRSSVDKAMAEYAANVKDIVGAENTIGKSAN